MNGKGKDKELKEDKPAKKEDWMTKTRKEKSAAAQTRWRSVSLLPTPLLEEAGLRDLIWNRISWMGEVEEERKRTTESESLCDSDLPM